MVAINKRNIDILKYEKNGLQNATDFININKLDIADGLRDMLIKSGLTWNELQEIEVSRISEALKIDSYIAKLIVIAIKKYRENYNHLG